MHGRITMMGQLEECADQFPTLETFRDCNQVKQCRQTMLVILDSTMKFPQAKLVGTIGRLGEGIVRIVSVHLQRRNGAVNSSFLVSSFLFSSFPFYFFYFIDKNYDRREDIHQSIKPANDRLLGYQSINQSIDRINPFSNQTINQSINLVIKQHNNS